MTRWLNLQKFSRWLILPPLLVGLGCLFYFASRRRELPRRVKEERSMVVQVERVVPRTVRSEAVGYGTAVPSRTWTAVAEVQGRIVDLHPRLESGYLVEEGTVLAVIDDADYEFRLKQRQADLDAALARVQELTAAKQADEESISIEQSLLEVNQKDVERFRTLRSNQAIAESEYENAKQALLRQTQAVQQLRKALNLYPPQIASAEANVELAKARLEEARRDVQRTVISNPLGGRLSGVSLEVGQFVNAGERLFEVQDALQVEVESQFSLAQLSRLVPGARRDYQHVQWESSNALDDFSAQVVVRSGDMQLRWDGEPLRFSDQVDEQTRTRGIVILIRNPSLEPFDNARAEAQPRSVRQAPLLPGTFCEVTLQGPALQRSITVPRTALEGDTLYVAEDDQGQQRLRVREVETGASIGRRVMIEAGLEAGDLVLVRAPAVGIERQLVEPVVVDETLSSPENKPEITGRAVFSAAPGPEGQALP